MTQTPDQTSDQTNDQTPDQTSAPVTDLDAAPDGTAPFTATATSIPEDSGEGGIIITRRDGDLGWQLATQNNRPRKFWQRTWHATENRWRTWKRFDDARNTERATAAAIRTAVDDAMATLRAEMPDMPDAPGNAHIGLDRDAVTALIATEIAAELADERTARNDAIAAATTSIAAGRQALITASITSAITTERVAADARVDEKIGRVTTRLDDLTDDLTAETAARNSALAESRRQTEASIAAERDARTAGIRTAVAESRRAVEAKITEAGQTAATDLRARLVAVQSDQTQAIATAKREVTRDLTGQVTRLLTALEGRIAPQLAAAGFPRGTRMLFQQSAAPAGWTKDATLNDKAIRIVSGSVGSGGHRGFSQACVMHRVTGSVTSRVSGSTGAHRLSVGEMPGHTHGWSGSARITHEGYNWSGNDSRPRMFKHGASRYTIDRTNLGVSGSNAHTGGSQPHSHSAGALRVASSFTGTALDMRLAYVDVIVAVKD